jgi:hypothetical protein
MGEKPQQSRPKQNKKVIFTKTIRRPDGTIIRAEDYGLKAFRIEL